MRRLPSVDRLLGHEKIRALLAELPRPIVVDAVRESLDRARASILADQPVDTDPDAIAAGVAAIAARLTEPSLRPAVNATGVILHTGLGRAVLAREAQEAVAAAASSHSTLEIDVETGRRGSRMSHVEGLLRRLTGAQSAMIVNNNAAAVLLAINTLADGQEVVISRGQLVEIGGQFRIPDVIRQAGCRLVEVGATNRTRISDYASAITEETALILRVHPSNFRIVGFTEEAALGELVELGESRGVPVMDDLGSGSLIDMARFGLRDEPTVQDSVRAGCGIIAFSGDKLLGGTQAGILLGRTDLIERCKRNPLARVVRVDKLTLAGLEATLRLYLDPDRALTAIPALRYISRPLPEIAKQAESLAASLQDVLGDGYDIEVVDVRSQVGGGSLPEQDLPSKAVTLRSDRISAEDSSSWFRRHRVPIFGRIENGRLVFDLRTVEPAEAIIIVDRARELSSREC